MMKHKSNTKDPRKYSLIMYSLYLMIYVYNLFTFPFSITAIFNLSRISKTKKQVIAVISNYSWPPPSSEKLQLNGINNRENNTVIPLIMSQNIINLLVGSKTNVNSFSESLSLLF